MSPGQLVLERRKLRLRATIGAQRLQLGRQLDAFRRPLQAFETARGLGEALRRHAKLASAIGLCALFIVMRSGLLSRALGMLRLTGTTTRWWALARLGWHLARRWRRDASLATREIGL